MTNKFKGYKQYIRREKVSNCTESHCEHMCFRKSRGLHQKNCVDPVGGPYPWSLVPTLNLGPFEVRVFWDTGASKTIGGIHEEEAIFRGANHVRIGAGIDRRDDRGDLSKAGGVAANF